MPQINESRSFAESASQSDGPGTFDILLINEGWGSSGYYPASALQEAARDKIFAAGTHMYINHPSYSEAMDRPERDLEKLAATLQEDAYWDAESRGLRAKATIYSNWRKPLAEMKDAIGVSIRGNAEVEEDGEADGRRGRIITRFTEGSSVDFVTHAGRGGKVVAILESAFATTPAPTREAMAGDTRQALNAALKATYGSSDTEYIYVRDWDPDSRTVYFDEETEDSSNTFAQGFTVSPEGTVSLVASRYEVRVQTSYVPVIPAGQSITPQESQEDTMPQIEETRLRALEEAERRVQSAEEAAQAAADKAAAAEERAAAAQEALRTSNNTTAAERIVAEAFDGLDAPATRRNLLRNLPLTQEGALDEEQFSTIAQESAAEFASISGAGRVTNLGESAGKSDDISEADLMAGLSALSGTIKEG